MKKFALLFVLITLAFDLSALAVGGNSTEYVGGTINAIKQNTDGKSSTADEKVFVFEYKHGKLNIPYDQINSLEYGEKAGGPSFAAHAKGGAFQVDMLGPNRTYALGSMAFVFPMTVLTPSFQKLFTACPSFHPQASFHAFHMRIK